jgi:hypothetical protein
MLSSLWFFFSLYPEKKKRSSPLLLCFYLD